MIHLGYQNDIIYKTRCLDVQVDTVMVSELEVVASCVFTKLHDLKTSQKAGFDVLENKIDDGVSVLFTRMGGIETGLGSLYRELNTVTVQLGRVTTTLDQYTKLVRMNFVRHGDGHAGLHLLHGLVQQ